MPKPKGKPPAKTASELTAAYQDRLKQDGGGRFPTLTLSPDEMARWRALEGRLGGADRGAAKRTLLACMAAAEGQGAPDVPGILRRLADQIEGGATIKTNRNVEVRG